MSVQQSNAEPKTKSFGQGERTIPGSANKALKFYPSTDLPISLPVRKPQLPTRLRSSLKPGAVLILLAGRFRGKRVVLLKHLSQGVLLVTGPFKLNGVPLRRVNARYVIATQTQIDVSTIDNAVLSKASEASYFTAGKVSKKTGEEAFFKQGEKPEPKKISSERIEDQKSVDKTILTSIKKEPFLAGLLSSTFSLRKGDRPHEMVF